MKALQTATREAIALLQAMVEEVRRSAAEEEAAIHALFSSMQVRGGGTGQFQAEHHYHPGPCAHNIGQAPQRPSGVASTAGQQALNCFPGVNHNCQDGSRREPRACPSWCWWRGMIREDFPQEVTFKLRALGFSGRGTQEGRPLALVVGLAVWRDSPPNQCVAGAQGVGGRWQVAGPGMCSQ